MATRSTNCPIALVNASTGPTFFNGCSAPIPKNPSIAPTDVSRSPITTEYSMRTSSRSTRISTDWDGTTRTIRPKASKLGVSTPATDKILSPGKMPSPSAVDPAATSLTLHTMGSGLPTAPRSVANSTTATRKWVAEPAKATAIFFGYDWARYVRCSSSGGTASRLLIPVIRT